jgi:hypothetical protein
MPKFRPGQTGNPAGRPRRPRLPGPDKLRADLLRDEVPGILIAMVAQAKGGDARAARLILDRCLPALLPQDAPVPLPPGLTCPTWPAPLRPSWRPYRRGPSAPIRPAPWLASWRRWSRSARQPNLKPASFDWRNPPMAESLERRLEALEAKTATVEQSTLLIYRSPVELATMLAQATARVVVCIPDNGRDPESKR